MKKFLAMATAAALALTMLAGCGGSSSSSSASNDAAAPAASDAADTEADTDADAGEADAAAPAASGGPVKMGVIIWGTTDALGRNSTMMIDKLCKVAGGSSVVNTNYSSPEDQIQVASDLIASGCNAIIIVNSSDTMLPSLASLCEDNEVYFGLMWRRVVSEEVREVLDACPYFVGNTAEDEQEISRRLANSLVDKGITKLAMIGRPVGDTTHDARWAGVEEVCENTDMELVSQYRGQNGAATAAETQTAVENFVSAYPDLQAIFLTGGTSSQLEGALNGLERTGTRGKICISCVDFIDADQMLEYLKDGTLASIAGGHYVDPIFTAAMLINAVEGNKLSDKPESIDLQFIDFQSAEDAVDYYDYVENDEDGIYAYTDEELGQLIKSINPDCTIDTIRETAAAYSIEDVMTRHGNN